jgi:hypothetical protein
MAKLSITTAWNETADILRRDFGALFTIALALNALPQILMQALIPTQTPPGAMPALGLWALLFPIMIILAMVGTIAITSLALGRERVVGAAIGHGFRRFLPLFGASFLIGIGFSILFIALALAFGINVERFVADPAGVGGRLALLVLICLPIALFVGVRMMMTTPVAAAESGGPIAILSRSWALTRGHFWKLLGFLLLVGIVFVIIMIVVGMVFGVLIALVAGRPEPGNFASVLLLILTGVVNAGVIAVLTSLIARVYVQLAGDPAVSQVFD